MSIQLTIIGAGPGGYVAAIRAAQQGARVTVVERTEVGGTCLNLGCIPTKTIIASAEALRRVQDSAEFGVMVSGEVTYNLARIRERRDKVVATQVKGVHSLLKSWGVHLIQGRGLLLSPDVVRVVQNDGATMDVRSDKVIIATGSRPARPSGFPFESGSVMTSDEAIRMESVPKNLLIVGAGVIGSEFAFIYRSFGAEVTLVEAKSHAISTEDEDMSEIIEREFKKSGIKLRTNMTVEQVEQKSDKTMHVTLSNKSEVMVESILISIGRIMNSEGLGLDDVGVKTGSRGEILVNAKMETNVPGIYAIGDVTGKVMLAHAASHQGFVAAENALGGNETMDYTVIPSGIFTMPEIGSVGLTEQQAKEKGISCRVGRFPFRGLGKAHAMGEIVGLAKIVTDAATDRVIGMHICGAHATDLVHEGALAIKMGATSRQLSGMIHAHPTLAEAIMEAAGDVHKTAIHVPKGAK